MMPSTAVALIPSWVLVGGIAATVVMLVFARLLGTTTSEAGRRLGASLGYLGHALAPMIVPVLVIGAVVTVDYGWRKQIIAGVLLAAVLWFLLRKEGELARQREDLHELPRKTTEAFTSIMQAAVGAERGLGAAVRPSAKTVRAASLPVLVLLAGAGVLALNWVGDGWDEWKTATGGSGFLIWLAIQMLILAAVLRIVGYATSRVRWAVVGFLAVIGVRLGMTIGLIDGEDRLDARLLEPGASAVILIAVVVILLAVEAIRLGGHPDPRPSLPRTVLLVGGFAAAALSAVLFAAGATWARSETTGGAEPVPGATAEQEPVDLVDVTGGLDRQLAWTFAPILRLHPKEEFPPTSAADFLEREVPDNPGCGPMLPGLCRRIRCPECADPANSVDSSLHPSGVVFYARVARVGDGMGPDAEALEGWTPGPRPVATLIQYWIFYDYNRWNAKTVFGHLVQSHEADWEFVAVGLDFGNQPLFLALSAHCGGQVVPWRPGLAVLPGRVEDDRVTIDFPTAEGTLPRGADGPASHPVVAVALGSHGNYADDSGRRPPDWGSCKKLPTDALSPLTYASNVRDLTAGGNDNRRLVQARDIESVTERDYPLNVGARWGTEDLSFGKRDFGPFRGPLSPPRQATWDQPIKLFFCNRHWRPVELRRAPKSEC